MSGARAFACAAIAIGCWGLVVAGAPNGLRAAVLPTLSMSDGADPAGARQYGRHGGILHRVQNAAGLNIIVDNATGVRVGIPVGIFGPPEDKKNGREWNVPPGRRLSINTLRISDGRSLDALLRTLKGGEGRKVKETAIPGGFKLEGHDNKGLPREASVYVEVHSEGGEIRGLSIVCSRAACGEFHAVIEKVKHSFVAFPVQASPPPPPPTASDPHVRKLEQELADAREQLRKLKEQEPNPQVRKLEQELAKVQAELKGLKEPKADPKADDLKDMLKVILKGLDDIRNQSTVNPPKTVPAGPGLPGLPGKRVAFVVGINAYKTLRSLETAVNDADGIGATLAGRGFTVIQALDVDRRTFYAKWTQFLAGIGEQGTAAVFFAGHGIQIDRANYLLPADAPSASVGPVMLREESIALNKLREDVESRKPGLSLFILDACRGDPFKGSPVRDAGITRGLGRVLVAEGSGAFVMYSAAEYQLALDRLPHEAGKAKNSVYVRNLIPWLKADDITLQTIAAHVGRDVQNLVATVRHEQTPRYDDGTKGPVCWSGHCADRTVQGRE